MLYLSMKQHYTAGSTWFTVTNMSTIYTAMAVYIYVFLLQDKYMYRQYGMCHCEIYI